MGVPNGALAALMRGSYANVKKCTPEGRQQMQLDYGEFAKKLSESTSVKCAAACRARLSPPQAGLESGEQLHQGILHDGGGRDRALDPRAPQGVLGAAAQELGRQHAHRQHHAGLQARREEDRCARARAVGDSARAGGLNISSIVPGAAKKAETQKRAKIMKLIDDIKSPSHTSLTQAAATVASGATAAASAVADQFAVLFK